MPKLTKQEASRLGRLGGQATHRDRLETIEELRKYTSKEQLDLLLNVGTSRPTSTKTLKVVLTLAKSI